MPYQVAAVPGKFKQHAPHTEAQSVAEPNMVGFLTDDLFQLCRPGSHFLR